MEEKIKSTDFDEWDNPDLREPVEGDNELKLWLVDYVGNKHKPENGNVTVEMIVETLAQDFPEFTLAVASENFLRGYHQALCDMEIHENKHHPKTS
jgi:hypothetical protein|tara:strand:+ start:1189 stop:1476 length:288 start_codon:yes stop_codon:yes gene_type:complete